MQQIKQRPLRYVFEDDYNVRNLRDHAHEKSDVRMAQDALHYDFILNFRQQLVGQAGVKDFLNGYRCSVQEAFMNNAKPALTDLFPDFNVLQGNFTNSWDFGQTTSSGRDFGGALCERGKVCFVNFFLEVFNLLLKAL